MIRKNGVHPATVPPLDHLSFLGERTLEDASAQLARDAGLDMPDTHSFDLVTRLASCRGSVDGARVGTFSDPEGPPPDLPPLGGGEQMPGDLVLLPPPAGEGWGGGSGRAHHPSPLDATPGAFGIARFDVEDGLRVPVHTLAGALQVDFRLPSAVDYTTLLPCYDLTFSEGPGGEHQMDVCGEGRDITRTHLLMLASQGGLDRAWATTVVERMVELAGRFSTIAAGRSIRQTTVKRVRSAIEANRLRLA